MTLPLATYPRICCVLVDMKLVGLLSLALVLVGCLSDDQEHFEKVAAELPAAKAAAVKAGVPMHPRELAPNPPVRPEDNAAPLLKQAGERLQELKPKGTAADLANLIRKPDAESRKIATDILAAINPALDLVVEATKRETVDFGRKWDSEDPMEDMLFPEYAQLREFTKLLTSRGYLRAGKGDTQGALVDLRASFKLAVFAGNDPLLIGALVQIAIDAIALRQVELILAEQPNDPGLLAALRELLREQPRTLDLWHCLKGEAASGINFFDKFPAMTDSEMRDFAGEEGDEPLEYPKGVSKELAWTAYKVRALQGWTEVAEGIRSKEYQTNPSDVLQKIVDRVEQSTDKTYMLQKFMMPVFSQSGQAIVTRRARLQVTEALLTTVAYKQASGSFPKTLVDAGYTETDPFNQKPLRMEVRNGVLFIWSVGKDLKDDGGDEKANKDIVARFPR